MSIIKWLALLPVLLLGKLLTVVCAPVAALLSMRGDALGLDDAAIDAMFVEAAKL